jgi:hypothetical protein
MHYTQNPTVNRNWEDLALLLPNCTTELSVLIDQLEIRYLETALALLPGQAEMHERLLILRRRMVGYAPQLGYRD